MTLNVLPNYFPYELNKIIMDLTGEYLPFSCETAKKGWVRFDFPFHNKPIQKITNLKLPDGIVLLVRDYLQLYNLRILYPHLKFDFEKQKEHFQMENLCKKPWEVLVKSKIIQINGATRENSNLGKEKIKGEPEDSWELPWVIGQCRRLSVFGVTESTCIKWPKNMAKLKNLREIYSVDNDYALDLGDWVGKIPKLQKISWEVNRKISREIKKCRFLTECHFYHVGKSYIPNLSKSRFLEVLSINEIENDDEYIPKWVGSCKSLKELIIENGNIKYLRDSLTNLELDYFSLQGNKIQELPKWFNYIRAGHINIANNEIEELPRSFVNLDYCVNYVSLFGNPLRVLPKGIEKLKKQVHFWIRDPDGKTYNSLCQQDIDMLEGMHTVYSY